MKTILTNRFTVVNFRQYGDPKQFQYRGELKEALSVLKGSYGIKSVQSGSTRTVSSFSTKGLASLLALTG